MKKILLFLCTILCANVLMAQTRFIVGDLTYYITSSSSNEVEVDDCNLEATAVIIPASVEYNGTTYSVTSIGNQAFMNCDSLISVTIPNSVTSIGVSAFSSCSSLTSVDIPSSVTSIGNYAFRGCSSLTSVTIPNSVTSIGNYAFGDCSSLTSVTIPNSVTSIGNGAFSYCYGLISVTIGNSVTSIGDYAFNSCSSLTSVIIPNSVTSIGAYAFASCNDLTSVTIGNSVTSIGNYAFRGCSSLTSVDIPNSVNTIGNGAFQSCDSLTSVTIGNSVTSIGNYAFEYCSSLTSVDIPNSVTSIGNYAFCSCRSLTSVNIPNSVTSIGVSAFNNCNSLTSVTIPNSVTSIGDYAFRVCNSLTSVTIPNSVTSIGYEAFMYCSSLTSVTIPNSVTSIGNGAFSSCYGLISVTIGNSVTSIGNNAFNSCSSLTSVTCLAETAPSLGSAVFSGAPSTKTLTVPCESDYSAWESATTWASVERIDCEEEECVDVFTIGDLTYEKTSATEVSVKDCSETATEVIIPASVEQCGITYSVTSIGDSAFYFCSSLTSITIPNSVTTIGGSAFVGCRSLTSIDIPNSVTTIGDWAFQSCSSLTSIDIPNGVTSIGDYAFAYCSSLTSITIPNSVTSIGEAAFWYCSSLTSIDIPNGVASIGSYAFWNCSSLTSVTCLAETAPSLGSSVFSSTPSTKVLNITCGSDYSSWESATDWASVECTWDLGNSLTYFPLTFAIISEEERTMKVSDCDVSATDVEIPARVMYNGINYSVTSIGNSAFYDCSSLISVTIPNSVTSIGNYAFTDCSSLTSVTIGNSVNTIGNGAFSRCSSLTSVDIPNSVNTIGDGAFSGCSSLTSVNIPNSVTSIGGAAFSGCSSLTSFDIPNSVTSINGTFSGCSSLTSVDIPNSVTSIGNSTFNNCRSLTSVTIPNSVTSIGNNAFYYCSSLTSVDIPNSVTSSIGEGAFYNCSSLTSVTIGNSVTSIGDQAFLSCDSLTSVTIGNSVTSIEYRAFSGCSSLTSVDIPNSVTSIGDEAFSGCSSLTSVTIPNSVTSIGNNAFRICDGLTSITIPNSVTSIGIEAFKGCRSLTSVTIPNSVTSIGIETFSGCSSLTSVTIGNSVTSIGGSAFMNCSSLTSVTIPNSVNTIGNRAFRSCYDLTSVTIPNSVTSIGEEAFYYCNSLTSVTCLAETAPSLGVDVFTSTPSTKILTVPCGSDYSAWESATDWASVNEDCPALEIGEQFTIGDFTYEVTSANEVAVKTYNNNTATSTEIPSTVTYEGTTYSVTFIQNKAFYNKYNLTSVTIPNTVIAIGGAGYYGAFENCDGLTSISIPNSVTSIGSNTFFSCSNLTSVDIPNSVTTVGSGAFWLCDNLTSINIPNSVTSIGTWAFYQCSSLTSVTLPNNANIFSNAFENAGVINVDGIYYGGAETVNIENYTFNNVGFITFYLDGNAYTPTLTEVSVVDCDVSKSGDIEIPSTVNGYSVTSIGNDAFLSCGSLTSVTIPNSVTSIGYWAFGSCSSLDSIICLAETAPSLGNDVFYSTPSTKTLTIPFGSNYSSWQSATTWAKTNYLIQEGEEKELASDFTINASTSLINNGVLRIKPTGQLINETSTNVSGVFEIETPTLPNDKWSFVGAPFNGYKLEAIKEGTRDVAVSVFDYGSADWSEEFATIETPIRKGEGFLLWSFAEEATVFTTNPENPSEEYTLNNGGVSVTETLTTHEGGGNWMALANPYTFKLDIAKFLPDQSDLKGGIVYRLNGVSWEEVSEGVIGLTEGFFVNYANPGSQTATFVKSHRYTGTSSKAEKKKEYIKLYMNDGERTSKLSIAQNEEASQGDDIFDANKLFSPFEIAEPYFLTEGVALVKEEVKTLPYTATLNVKSYESKEVTFSVGDIPEDYNVYLIDNGFDIKMNDGVEYNTRIVAGENADRFKFVIKKAHRLTETVNKDIYVNNFNREVRISSTQKDLKIEVYDALGRKVFETKDYKFELNQVPAGAYMVKVYNRFARKDAKIVLH